MEGVTKVILDTEEKKIQQKYTEYQLSTVGIDIWEEGAFRAGWSAAKQECINQLDDFYKRREKEYNSWVKNMFSFPFPIKAHFSALKKFITKLKDNF